MYRVDLAERASRFYADADRPLARRLARCFEQLEREPRRGNNIQPLKGKLAGYFRYRVGDWRVIYRIIEQRKLVIVIDIAHRSEVYE